MTTPHRFQRSSPYTGRALVAVKSPLSLPCAKGGGLRTQDGGIVKNQSPVLKQSLYQLYNPSPLPAELPLHRESLIRCFFISTCLASLPEGGGPRERWWEFSPPLHKRAYFAIIYIYSMEKRKERGFLGKFGDFCHSAYPCTR